MKTISIMKTKIAALLTRPPRMRSVLVCLAFLALFCFEVFGDIEADSDDPASAGWVPQQEEGGDWLPAPEGVSIERNAAGECVITWAAGYGGKNQLRVVRTFPPTTTDKVIVQFSFLPGAETLGGRLYFCKSDQSHIMALQFLEGHVWVMEGIGEPNAIDTGVAFEPDEWNRVEMRLDFKAHQGEIILNGKSVGIYRLSPNATAVSFLNFFAGGLLHSSSLKGISICSVESFPNEPVKPGNK